MTTAKELVFDRIDLIDDRITALIEQINANSELGTYVGRTVQNTIPSIIEMISEIVKYIGDDELTEIVTAKLAVLSFEQTRFDGDDNDE